MVASACDDGGAGISTTGMASTTSSPPETTLSPPVTFPSTITLPPEEPPGIVADPRYRPDPGLPPFPGREELLAAWALWESQGLESYRFVIGGSSSWIGFGRYEVLVTGDKVSVVTVESPPSDWPQVGWSMFGPVERLLALIESLPSESLSVEYDPDMGYATRVDFDDPGWVDEEWWIVVSELKPFDGEHPTEVVDAPTSDWKRHSRHVGAVIEGTVGGPERFVDESAHPGWVVPVEGFTVHYHRSGLDSMPFDPLKVFDSWWGVGPRTLRNHEGERLILFLFATGLHDAPVWTVRWVAHRTADGLEFIGPEAEFSTINDDLPTLCGPSSGTRDADAELDLLICWLQEVEQQEERDREAALEVACTSDD